MILKCKDGDDHDWRWSFTTESYYCFWCGETLRDDEDKLITQLKDEDL